MLISVSLTVVAQTLRPLGDGRIACEKNPSVSHRPKVLGRIQARAGRDAGRRSWAPRALRAGRLRAVLDDKDPMLVGEAFQANWIHGMAIEVDRHDCTDRTIRTQGRADLVEIQPPGLIDIAPHRLCTRTQDRECRCKGGKGRGSHTIAGGHTCAAKRNLQRVQAARNANRMRNSPPCRELLLKRRIPLHRG